MNVTCNIIECIHKLENGDCKYNDITLGYDLSICGIGMICEQYEEIDEEEDE